MHEQSDIDIKDTQEEQQEAHTLPVWFDKNSCTVCSVGVTSRMQTLIDSGMSQRKAAKVMSEETEGEVSADVIRMRYGYYKKPQKKTAGKQREEVEVEETFQPTEQVTDCMADAKVEETFQPDDSATDCTTDAEVGKTFQSDEQVLQVIEQEAQVGRQSLLEETFQSTEGQPFTIPLHVGQTELINALADFFHDKGVLSPHAQNTFNRTLSLMDRRKNYRDAKGYRWEDHQRFLES